MMNHSIIISECESGTDYVGICKDEESYSVSVPYGFSKSYGNNANSKEVKLYAAAINKALSSSHIRKSLENSKESLGAPIAALHLLIDYIQNGPFHEIEKTNAVRDRGKINFKKTLSQFKPTIIDDDAFFDSFVVEKTRFANQDIVSIAQVSVINHFMEAGGELLFGCYIKINSASVPLNKQLESRLNKAKHESFNSRKHQLINWIIDYINGAVYCEDQGSWKFMIAASSLWEEMIDGCYSNQTIRDKTKYGYSFNLQDKGDTVYSSKKSEHDTIYETEKSVVVIDAKMYNFINNLISPEVLYKQHFYYYSARITAPKKRIYNVLIKPHTDSDKEPGIKGIIPGPGRKIGFDTNDFIIVYAVDFKKVLESYFSGKKLCSELFEEITKMKL